MSTHQEILERAIEKAEQNGWKPEAVGMVTIISHGWMQHDHYKAIIFNHDFCKAIWPGTDDDRMAILGETDWRKWPLPWEYHIKNMVVADDPIEYLGQHLGANL